MSDIMGNDSHTYIKEGGAVAKAREERLKRAALAMAEKEAKKKAKEEEKSKEKANEAAEETEKAREKAEKERLFNTFGAKVCDMESAGVLLTAKGYDIPCVIIKAVSDGEGGAEEFNLCVHKASLQYIDALKQIVKEF